MNEFMLILVAERKFWRKGNNEVFARWIGASFFRWRIRNILWGFFYLYFKRRWWWFLSWCFFTFHYLRFLFILTNSGLNFAGRDAISFILFINKFSSPFLLLVLMLLGASFDWVAWQTVFSTQSNQFTGKTFFVTLNYSQNLVKKSK